MEVKTYALGHDASTLSSHRSRSAEVQADYLIPHIKPTDTILDVGCGPGTITCGFANLVPRGKVVGVDYSDGVLQHARAEAAERELNNVEFKAATAYELPFPDDAFDIVHCHAVLVHLPNALNALKAMRRVCRPGGFVAAREPDWDTCIIHPFDTRLQHWKELHMQLKRNEGTEPNAGRHLAEWAIAAGFNENKIEISSNVLEYSGAGRKWWGELTASRMKTEFGKRAVASGLASTDDVDGLVAAWLDWSDKKAGLWAVMHQKLLCQK